MHIFTKKPDEIEAMQFTGTRERAEDIATWLDGHGYTAHYDEAGSAPDVEGNIFEGEQVVIRTPWFEQGVHVGGWITYDPNAWSMTTYTDEQFNKRFASKTDETTPPEAPTEPVKDGNDTN